MTAKKFYFHPRKDEIKIRPFNFLTEKPILVPRKWVFNTFVALFYKTPKDIVCPHFWVLKPFIGCPYQCSYCFLQGTFFGNKKPRIKDMDKMVKVLNEFFSWADSVGIKLLLNVGELCDSLAIPAWTNKFLEKIIPILEKNPGNKLLFLSKAGQDKVSLFLDNPDLGRFIVMSFSLNPQPVINDFEKGTASLEDRLRALKKLQQKRYEIRIRIDPIIPVENWQGHYSELLMTTFKKFRIVPKRITLGSLRGLAKTIFYARDKRWIRYLDKKEKTGWGLKIQKGLRLRLYETLLKEIRKHKPDVEVALCKETYDLYKILADRKLLEYPGSPPSWRNIKCNCKF